MSNVADIHTIIEIPGHIGIYEVQEGKALLVKECVDRDEAEEWLTHERFMDQSCDQLQEEYLALVGHWLTDKAKETGIERKYICDWIVGLDIPRTINEDPAESANDQRGEEKDPMQDPSAIRIPDYSTQVEPPKPAFPLPADHECDRQGVPGHYTGEWDYAEDHDLPS